MDDSKRCCGLWYDEREPRRHMTADLSRDKLNLQRSQKMFCCMYDCSCLSAINDASLLNTTVAVDPNPPVVEKTNGEKVPNSNALLIHMHISFPVQHGGSTVVMEHCLK